MPTKPKTKSDSVHMLDTKQCPYCRQWVVSPGDEIHAHAWREHRAEVEAQEEKHKAEFGSYSGRYPGYGRESDEEDRPRVRPVKATKGDCLCGCGEPVVKQFKPGHDARLKGSLIKLQKEGVDVRTDGRVSPEVRAVLPSLFKGRFK